MSLFPFVTTEDLTLTDQEVTASSIREYEIDFEKGTLTGRIVTGVDALCVWAYLALKAENEHITGVQDLEVSQIKDVLHIKFTLVTDVGSKEVEMDV